MSGWAVLADLRDDAARIWPAHPWPETIVADELIAAFARLGLYDLKPSEPPF